MMTIARLFGKSPFAPLQSHMAKVASCIEQLTKTMTAIAQGDLEKAEHFTKDLSQLEHEADLTKNDIRNHLPKSLFMPIDKAHFLEILAIQDSIADKAEEIAFVLTLRPLALLSQFSKDLDAFFQKALQVFWESRKIIDEIDELLESAFGGIEAQKVKLMVEKTAQREHEVQELKHAFLKRLYTEGETLSPPAFSHWQQVIEDIGALAQRSEKLANRIRMVLELK